MDTKIQSLKCFILLSTILFISVLKSYFLRYTYSWLQLFCSKSTFLTQLYAGEYPDPAFIFLIDHVLQKTILSQADVIYEYDIYKVYV